MRRTAAPLLALALLAVPVLTACSGDDATEADSAADLLAHAKHTLDEADSVHFVLDSEGAPDAGTALVGGEGVYAQLPFTSGFSVVDPAQFGFGDPGALIDPGTGISQLLAEAESAELGEERRVDGEVVREVTADLPGELVEQLLASEDPARAVRARFSIAEESGELLRAELTGPFFAAEDDATYILELSDFGADVEITAPTPG
jgi:hypothetical protein